MTNGLSICETVLNNKWGDDIFEPKFSPESEKWSEKLSKSIEASTKSYRNEKHRFGGDETYGAPIYNFFMGIIDYFK